MDRALIKSLSFDQGPPLLVQLLLTENLVQKITLKLHTHFEVQFIGADCPQLIGELTDWFKAYSEKKPFKLLPFDLNSLPPLEKRFTRL